MKETKYKDLSPWLRAGMVISWLMGAMWILIFVASMLGVY
jgi:hypothetical protein